MFWMLALDWSPLVLVVLVFGLLLVAEEEQSVATLLAPRLMEGFCQYPCSEAVVACDSWMVLSHGSCFPVLG